MKHTTKALLLLTTIYVSNAETFTVENNANQTTIQLADSSGNILTSGAVDFLYRISGSDTDSAITTPSAGLGSYISSNFATLSSGSITQETFTPLLGGTSDTYYAFEIDSPNLVSGNGGYGENPYFYVNTGGEALLYKFNETMIGAPNVDFEFTLGDDQDLGVNLIGSFNTEATDIGGVDLDTYSLEAIPEPSSVALLGLGSLALISRRKR